MHRYIIYNTRGYIAIARGAYINTHIHIAAKESIQFFMCVCVVSRVEELLRCQANSVWPRLLARRVRRSHFTRAERASGARGYNGELFLFTVAQSAQNVDFGLGK